MFKNSSIVSYLTDKSPGSLASNFDAKCTRRMRLIWIAFHGYIPFRYEGPIHATIIFVSVLCVVIFWPNASGFSLVFCGTTLEAFYTFAWKGKFFFHNLIWQLLIGRRNGFNEWRKLIDLIALGQAKNNLHFHTAISSVSKCQSISRIIVHNLMNLFHCY